MTQRPLCPSPRCHKAEPHPRSSEPFPVPRRAVGQHRGGGPGPGPNPTLWHSPVPVWPMCCCSAMLCGVLRRENLSWNRISFFFFLLFISIKSPGVYFGLPCSYPGLQLCQSSGITTVSPAMSAPIHAGRGPWRGGVGATGAELTSGFLHSGPGRSGLTAMIRDLTLNTAGDFCPLRVANGTGAKRGGTELLPDGPAPNAGSL